MQQRRAPMDPPPAEGSRRRTSGIGGKGCGGSRLGLKTPTPPPASSPAPPLVPPPPSSAPAPPQVPPPPISIPTVPTSSPAVPTSTAPPRPPHGAGWGAIPPNFPSQHGNQQAPNAWCYPPGGFRSCLLTKMEHKGALV